VRAKVLSKFRRRLTARIVDRAYESMARAGGRLPPAKPEFHGIERVTDLSYSSSDRMEHRLDVYRPRSSSGPLPIVLYAHGGAFRALSKDTHWLMGLIFARRGYVCFNVSYRLAPGHRFPCALEDVSQAYVWVAENARRFGGDPSRVVLAGESAGANLVTGLAIAASYKRKEPFARAVFDAPMRPRVLAPVCGMLQMSDPARFARRKPLPRWLLDQIELCSEEYLPATEPEHGLDLADPLCILERGLPPERPFPAVFSAVGTRDPLLDDTRRLQRALVQLGVPADVTYYPREMHAFHALIWRKNARDCWRRMLSFAGDHLGMPMRAHTAVELRPEAAG
jgi:acetyl esterase